MSVLAARHSLQGRRPGGFPRRRGAGLLERWLDVRESAIDRHHQRAGDRVRIAALGLDTEAQLLSLPAGDVQRPEQPIPDAQTKSEVLVEMDRIGRVMDLMVRRAQEQATPDAREDDPEMRMLQVPDEKEEG